MARSPGRPQGLLVGCGGDDDSDDLAYCVTVALTLHSPAGESGAELEEFDERDWLDAAERIAALAPDDLKDDWRAWGRPAPGVFARQWSTGNLCAWLARLDN